VGRPSGEATSEERARPKDSVFGTDGVRGVANRDLTVELALDLAVAAAHVLGEVGIFAGHRPTAVVGRDPRASGEFLDAAIVAGLASAGVDVSRLGVIPTPGVAYLTRALRLSLGVVISASHNPYGDNGIKFFSARGEKLPDAWELDVEKALEQPPKWADSAQLGKVRRLDDAGGRYVEFCITPFRTTCR